MPSLAYASVTPRPLAVLAPGCDIEDTEEGRISRYRFDDDRLDHRFYAVKGSRKLLVYFKGSLSAGRVVTYKLVRSADYLDSGSTKALKGVHLIDDMTFSVTIAASELPYHYDLAYASVTPIQDRR